MNRARKQPEVVSIAGLGWPSPATTIALIRLRNRPGFAVGVQDPWRRDGVGRVWRSLRSARRRAAYLAQIHNAPVLEAI